MSEGMAFAGDSFGYDSKSVFKYRDKEMCEKWHKVSEDFLLCSFDIYNNPYGNYKVDGSTKNVISDLETSGEVYAKYWAANKPTYSESYAGSGLPYPNEYEAFENSNNRGMVKVAGGRFSFNLDYPNSYYIDFFKTYVPPQVNVQFVDKNQKNISKIYTIKLGNGIPFRSLTWPKKRDMNRGPMFFCNNNLPVRTQAQILVDSAYPCTNQEPTNFWGLNPPN